MALSAQTGNIMSSYCHGRLAGTHSLRAEDTTNYNANITCSSISSYNNQF